MVGVDAVFRIGSQNDVRPHLVRWSALTAYRTVLCVHHSLLRDVLTVTQMHVRDQHISPPWILKSFRDRTLFGILGSWLGAS
jgi:hypothetical protein